VAVLGSALFAAAVLLLYLGRNFTFIQDTWYFLLDRPGVNPDAFLKPHNEHIVVIPVAIEKVLVALFGMTSALPERIVLTAMLLATAVLVFVYVRRRIGPWPGVIAAALLLFLGPSWSVLLWPFEIVIVGSVLAGVAMLLLLEREDKAGDAWACLLAVLSVGFSSLGVSFAIAAGADVLVHRRQRGMRRAWIALVPLVLYAVWYLGWGHEAPHHLTLDNALSSPVYLLNGFASSLDSLLGLSTIDVNDVGQPEWGRPLLLAAIALVAWGQTRRRGFSPRLWPVTAAAVSYWLLAGFNYFPGRPAVAGRYGYAGAAFVLLIAADLLRGVRFGRTALMIGAVVTTLAVASNLVFFRTGKNWLEEVSILTRADTGALDIAKRTVAPDFSLTPEVAGTASLEAVDAEHYFEATREHGSPGYSPSELAGAPESARRQADIVLSQALPLSAQVRPDGFRTGGGSGCTIVAGDGAVADLAVPPGLTRIEVSPGPAAEVSLRRFATGEFPVPTAGAPGGSVMLLRVPRDASRRPWHLHVQARQTARVCR
jgi:hypothetical protein